jgi:hypothetical protein
MKRLTGMPSKLAGRSATPGQMRASLAAVGRGGPRNCATGDIFEAIARRAAANRESSGIALGWRLLHTWS